MKKITFIFLLTTCFSSISSAGELLVGEGTHEVSGSGAMSITRVSGGATTFNFQAGYGYFVTDFFEPGVSMQFAFNDNADAEGFIPTATFYYNKGHRVLPFIGLGAGVLSVSATALGRTTSFVLGTDIGILVPLTKHAGLNASFLYERTFANGGSNIFVISPVGLSLFF